MITVNHIKENINYKENSHILEIGCGAGALLKVFENNNEIYGIEPSNNYYNIVRRALPQGKFILGDALQIEKIKDNSLDVVLSHSCIQYFPSLEYFEKCINLVYKKLKSGGRIAFTDLQDKDKENECIKHRISLIGEENYKAKYVDTGLNHFYISRDEITKIVQNKFNNIHFTNAVKRGNELEFFRFNFFCIKN